MNGGEGKSEVERKEKVVSKMQKTWKDAEILKKVCLKLTYGFIGIIPSEVKERWSREQNNKNWMNKRNEELFMVFVHCYILLKQ